MKICMIFNTPPDELTTHIEELVCNLANLGIEVHLIVPETKVKQHRNIKTYFIKRNSYPWFIKTALLAITSCKIYYRQIRKQGVDLVYVASLHFALVVMPFVKIKHDKLIIEINGYVGDEFASKRKWGKYLKPIIDAFETYAFKNAVSVIAVTDGIRVDLLRRGISPGKIHVIENGANIQMFKPVEKNKINAIKKSWGLDNNVSIIAFVGRLYPWQGLEYLVMSAPEIITAFPDVRFLIVGDGIIRNKLESMIHMMDLNKWFYITGMLPYKKVPELINISDVCVAPFVEQRNQKIGLSPLKLCEYLSCEKPVIASRIKGLELLEEYDCGILVNPDNAQDLAKAIIKLLSDNNLRYQMGKNGRKYVIANRNWEKAIQKVADVVEQVEKPRLL